MNRVRYITWILLVCMMQTPAYSGVPQACVEVFADVRPSVVRQHLRNLRDAVVMHVLKEGRRQGFADVTLDAANRQVVVRADGEVYYLKLTDKLSDVYPHQGPPEVTLDGAGNVTATLWLHPDHSLSPVMLSHTIGAFRSALRAGILHPHSPPPGHHGPYTPSYPQREAIDALTTMALAQRAANPGGPVKVGLMMPGGNGKTIMAAKYAKTIAAALKDQKGWKKKPKVLVLVNNVDLLGQMQPVFERELGLKKFSPIFGDHLPASVDPTADLHATTPISFLNRIEEFKRMMKEDPDQPWLIFLDEAHHTETPNGRFQDIRQFIDQNLDHRHHVLAASAFFGYRDTSLFRDFLGGNVHASGLTPDEQRQLRKGDNLAELAYVQYVRAVMDGYAAPIAHLEIASDPKYRDVLGSSYVDKDGRHAKVYHDLLKDMAERLKRSKDPNVPQRGIVYVDLTKRADAYALELAKLTGVEVRAYHSGEESSPDAKDWIADRGKYATDADKKKDKIIVVVDSLNEGFDAPGINTVVFARNYQSTFAGFGYFRQNQARSERVHPVQSGQFKPGVTVIDYSQQSLFLHQGLSQVMVAGRNHGGGNGRVRVRQGNVDIEMDPIEFEARRHEFFPELRKDFEFAQHYPFFKYDTFSHDTLPLIARQARNLGIERWTGEGMPAKDLVMRLAKRLPDGMPGKAELLKHLDDDAYWGWKDKDGRDAANKIAPARRIYRALHEIAALYRLLPEGRDIDLTKLHEPKAMEDFFVRFMPELRPLRGPEELAQFVHAETGALPLLIETTGAMPDKVKADRQLLKLLQLAATTYGKKNPDANSLLPQLTSLHDGWPERDTHKILGQTSDQSLAYPLYREWRKLADVWNKANPQDKIDLAQLHTRAEMHRLLERLFGYPRPPAMDAEHQKQFGDRDFGAVATLFDRASDFGVNSVQLDFGGRKLAEKMVKEALRMAPDDPQLLALQRDIDSNLFDWKQYETFQGTGAERIHRVAFAAASVLQKRKPELGLEPNKLYTREGMDKLMDALTWGISVPTVTDAQLKDYRTGGVIERLQRLNSRVGLRSEDYYNDHGMNALFLKLIEKAPDSPAKRAFETSLNNKMFGKLDGEQARRGNLGALRKVHRALHAVREIWQVSSVEPTSSEPRPTLFTTGDFDHLATKVGYPPVR